MSSSKSISRKRAVITEVTRILERAGITRIDKLDRLKIRTAIATMPAKPPAKDKLKAQTKNHMLAAVLAFANWLVDEAGRLPFHKLRSMEKWNVDVDRARIRGIIDEDAILGLIENTKTEKRRGGMTGEERSIRYAMSIATGFRQGTLFSLTPESFHLDARPPYIKVKATWIKSRKTIEHRIREDLADLLRPWLAEKPDGKPIFPRLPWCKPIKAFRADLKAVGIVYNPVDTIIYFDQHSFRNAFITAVIRAAGLKVAQDLAHHSTPVLTSKYARLGMDDYAKGLEGLPAITRKVAKRKGKVG